MLSDLKAPSQSIDLANIKNVILDITKTIIVYYYSVFFKVILVNVCPTKVLDMLCGAREMKTPVLPGNNCLAKGLKLRIHLLFDKISILRHYLIS